MFFRLALQAVNWESARERLKFGMMM